MKLNVRGFTVVVGAVVVAGATVVDGATVTVVDITKGNSNDT